MLRDEIKKTKQLLDLLDSIHAFEKTARQNYEAVLATGSYEDERELKKLSDARLRLDMVPSRKKMAEANLKTAIPELRQALRIASNAWGAFVQSKAREVQKKYLEAVAPFYTDNPRMAKKQLDEGHFVPLIAETLRAHVGVGYDPNATPHVELNVAECWVRSVKKKCEVWGWDYPDY